MNQENNSSIASNDRIIKLVEEAEIELNRIKPEIEYLEQCQKKLRDLKEQQFKLTSLIISLKSVMKIQDVNNPTESVSFENYVNNEMNPTYNDVISNGTTIESERRIFMPDQAISQVKNYLRTKNNLNYEIYKAVVFNSGIASTLDIKNYLIENNLKQPKTGKSFEDVELKEISSRTNYLVRKNVLTSPEPGNFRSVFGWCQIS